jgi:hypothetical protein
MHAHCHALACSDMNRCPPEILDQIFTEALRGIDPHLHNQACMALGGISRHVRALTTRARWRSVSLVGARQLLAFAALVEGKPKALWPVENLLLCDTLQLAWPSSPEDWARPSTMCTLWLRLRNRRATASVLLRKADAAIVVTVTRILRAVSHSLRTLVWCIAGFFDPTFPSVALPNLHSLTFTCFIPSGASRRHPYTARSPMFLLSGSHVKRLHIVCDHLSRAGAFLSLAGPELSCVRALKLSTFGRKMGEYETELIHAIQPMAAKHPINILIHPLEITCCTERTIRSSVDWGRAKVAAIQTQLEEAANSDHHTITLSYIDPEASLSIHHQQSGVMDRKGCTMWDDWASQLPALGGRYHSC